MSEILEQLFLRKVPAGQLKYVKSGVESYLRIKRNFNKQYGNLTFTYEEYIIFWCAWMYYCDLIKGTNS